MDSNNTDTSFHEQMERIKFITGKRTQRELADLLGVKQHSASDAQRRGKIPSRWLVILMQLKNIHPEWILTSNGPYSLPKQLEDACYETGDEAAERRAEEKALRRLPSRMLADELVRRIAVSQD